MRLILLACVLMAYFSSVTLAQARDSILVFAPASMTDVLSDVGQQFEQQTGASVVISFAGTQQLARQLDAGAPADLFITADRDWMDWVVERGLPFCRFTPSENKINATLKRGRRR